MVVSPTPYAGTKTRWRLHNGCISNPVGTAKHLPVDFSERALASKNVYIASKASTR